MFEQGRVSRPYFQVAPCALLTCLVLTAWNPGARALAGCGVGAPTLLCGPQQMPSNGTLALVLTHPLWHSRRAATGPRESGAPLGTDAEDLPFVLSRSGSPEPLRIQAKRDLPRGGVVVELMPAAGWLAGATYELRSEGGQKSVYPVFSAIAGPDLKPPTWETQRPTATVIRPPIPESERPPKPPHKHCETTGTGKTQKTVCTTTTDNGRSTTTERCVTTGSGKLRHSECSFSGSGRVSASCPPSVTEAHVALRLPALKDDHGGVIMLEVRAGATTTWVPAARELDLGLSSACTPPNFPPPQSTPYELLVTPVDAAQNRGVTLHIQVN